MRGVTNHLHRFIRDLHLLLKSITVKVLYDVQCVSRLLAAGSSKCDVKWKKRSLYPSQHPTPTPPKKMCNFFIYLLKKELETIPGCFLIHPSSVY